MAKLTDITPKLKALYSLELSDSDLKVIISSLRFYLAQVEKTSWSTGNNKENVSDLLDILLA